MQCLLKVFLFKEKHYKKSGGYHTESKDGASESVWDNDEVEIKPLQDGGLCRDLVFHMPCTLS